MKESTYKIICDDALDALSSLPKESFDACVTDPPYGETSLDWDRQVEWLSLVRRVLKPSGSLWFFTSVRHLLSLDLTGWKFAQDIVWEKHNGSNFHADRFRRVHELAVQLYPADVPWSEIYKSPVTTADATKRQVRRKKRPTHTGHIEAGSYESIDGGPRLARSVMQVRSCHGYAQHPTQKPVDIVRPLVEYSCPPNGTVLDPFCGSGTTGEVCVATGRSFLGIELNLEYAEIGRKRLSEVQIGLFQCN